MCFVSCQSSVVSESQHKFEGNKEKRAQTQIARFGVHGAALDIKDIDHIL
jgi:hypothetical protein